MGVMNVKGKRITWLVELGKPPMPEVFESPRFKIGRHENFGMKFYPKGLSGNGRCTLSLHCPDPRPAGLHVMLFAGKGWKQKNLKPWPDGEDMTEQFDIYLG